MSLTYAEEAIHVHDTGHLSDRDDHRARRSVYGHFRPCSLTFTLLRKIGEPGSEPANPNPHSAFIGS
jgi:hypothetical protein